MAKGKIPGFRQASVKEARELSKLPWVRDDALSHMPEARLLPDGRVLLWVADGERGPLYPSRAAAEEMNRQLVEMERETAKQAAGVSPRVGPQTLLPPIDDFLRDVEAHAKSLGARIKVAGEALDGSVASLAAVDKALKRIPRAERPVADLVTPLVAYVGEVMRKASGGRWLKTSHKHQVARCDPDELLAQWAAKRKLQPIAIAAGDKAKAEAKARGASAEDVEAAYFSALRAIQEQVPGLKSYRIEDREDHKPVVVASNGQSFDPFGDVFIWMVEPSKRNSPRATVEARLWAAGYRPAPKPAG
jgi:hypothetical protein